MNSIFNSNFFHVFTPSNSEELVKSLNDQIKEKNTEDFSWSENCIVDVIPLRNEIWVPHILPSLNEFSKHFSYGGGYEIMDPWINLYNYNGFQELHTHPDCDIVCVFYINSGPNFGKLYFYDRLSGILNRQVEKLVGYSEVVYPDLKGGQCIMFPSHLFHGVTPHKNTEIRKTFAFNFKLI